MSDQQYITTIKVMSSTRDALKTICRKDETYDDKIKELIELANTKEVIDVYFDKSKE